MKGLIKRQDAIDAINRCMDIYINNLQTMIYKADAYKALADLPSAQTDVPDRKVGKWIPVSERLPGYGEQVVANFRNEQISRNRIGVSYCYVQKEGFFSDVPFEYKVVAWMPLPDPWKEEEG